MTRCYQCRSWQETGRWQDFGAGIYGFSAKVGLCSSFPGSGGRKWYLAAHYHCSKAVRIEDADPREHFRSLKQQNPNDMICGFKK